METNNQKSKRFDWKFEHDGMSVRVAVDFQERIEKSKVIRDYMDDVNAATKNMMHLVLQDIDLGNREAKRLNQNAPSQKPPEPPRHVGSGYHNDDAPDGWAGRPADGNWAAWGGIMGD